ncbi:MlaD family protein [Hydrogenophaga sp. 5NK40-0174]|uniref:MlaD family protein n=1 Tax=Hydrogenophaga sp. 5NK40-0174 TaxID=3127649 RepID=UPI00310490ED
MTSPHQDDQRTAAPSEPPVENLEFKAALLVMLLVGLVIASAAYVMYARGVFEQTQRLVLVADDSEGVSVGMNMTFAGFSIGRVAKIDLAEDGKVHIQIDVPRKEAHWLRTSSIFTMEKGLVGGTRIKAFSGVLDDPPLPDGAVREVLAGDISAEIPKIVGSARDLLANLESLTGSNSALAQAMTNIETVTQRLAGENGAVGMLMGNEDDANKVVEAIERANAVLTSANKLSVRLDSIVANADRQVFGQGAAPGEGALVPDLRETVKQINTILGQARESLEKVDAVLADAEVIAGNTKDASADLTALRADVENSLRKVNSLVNDINEKWPFSKEAEVKLP